MSGRDYRSFVSTHRDEHESLVRRQLDGLGSNKYKPVDYVQLKALTAEKRLLANRTYVKVKKISQASKQTKEQNLLKQQKAIWQKEFMRLNSQKRRLLSEMEAFVHQNLYSDLEYDMEEYQDFESMLNSNLIDFKTATIDSVWNLREDLQFWLHNHKDELNHGFPVDGTDGILEAVKSVKSQQTDILEHLQEEQNQIEAELNETFMMESMPSIHYTEARLPHPGVPREALSLECPNLDLKEKVLQEFIFLDDKYEERLKELESRHESIVSTPFGGWCEEDHYIYQCTVEQYPRDMVNRRLLYIDRLLRQLPQYNRQELMEHDEWWTFFRYYHERRRVIATDWVIARTELLNRAKNIFHDACVRYEEAIQKAESRHKQKDVCDELYLKVREWREQKMELMAIEREMELEKQLAEEEEARRLEEFDKIKREKEKEQIKKYHEQVQKKRLEKEEKDQKRLEELRARLEETAAYDRERVKFRDTQYEEKMEEKRHLEEERVEAEREREDRLEELRKQVRVEASFDPVRMMGDTEATKNRMYGEEEVNIRKPLFELNSFSSKQITSDARVRLETKLREAGLHNTDYARNMMTQMAPPQAPRRDMQSSVFQPPR